MKIGMKGYRLLTRAAVPAAMAIANVLEVSADSLLIGISGGSGSGSLNIRRPGGVPGCGSMR